MADAEQTILIVGGSPATNEAASTLTADSWSVEHYDSLVDARESLSKGSFKVVVIDPESLGLSLFAALDSIRELDTHAAVIALAESGTTPSFDGHRRPAAVVHKPIERTALLMAADSAMVFRRLMDENRALKHQLGRAISLNDWVGCTPESQELRKVIATTALSDGPVLILGETGSGRRLLAELLHRHGRHAGQTFLAVDLASMSEGDFEALVQELADTATTGRFGHASVGTLYLAELTELEPVDQGALRRVLDKNPGFRIVASAHPEITTGPAGHFEFDPQILGILGRRSIHVPPLRARRGDIPVLIDHFLKKFCRQFELQALGIPSGAIENYSSYDWPGNVAELSMQIERAVSIASAAKFDGTTLPEHFCAPPSLTVPEPTRLRNVSLKELIADIEKRIIVQTLERVEGSQKKAAEQLRLNPTTLHEKMKRYKLIPEKTRSRV